LKHPYLFAFLFLIGGLTVVAAYTVYPDYSRNKILGESISRGIEQLEYGEVNNAVAEIRHGVATYGGIGALPESSVEALKMALTASAHRNLFDSAPILDLLAEYAMDPACDKRIPIYHNLVKKAYIDIFKSKKRPIREMEEAMYLAARWAGQCEVPAEELSKFKQVFNLYMERMGGDFQKKPWMTLALNGAPVAGEPRAPASEPAVTETTEAAPPAQSASPDQPEEKKQAHIALSLLPGKHKSVKAAATKTSQKTVMKPTPMPVADEEPVKQNQPAASPAPKKMAKPEPEAADPFQKAKSDIIRQLMLENIEVKFVDFRSEGRVLDITFNTGYVGTSKLKDITLTVLKTVDDSMKISPSVPLEHIFLTINDPNGRTVAQLGIDYADFISYRDGEISWDQLRNRWKEDIYD